MINDSYAYAEVFTTCRSFKPFVRADDSRNSKTGGSGLGLSIAKKIAEAHGGDLSLYLKE